MQAWGQVAEFCGEHLPGGAITLLQILFASLESEQQSRCAGEGGINGPYIKDTCFNATGQEGLCYMVTC
jgi:hypothetical protein